MTKLEFKTPIELVEYLRAVNLIYRYDTYPDAVRTVTVYTITEYIVTDQPNLRIHIRTHPDIGGYDIFFLFITPEKEKYFNFLKFPEFLEAIENLNLKKLFLVNLDLFL